MTGIDDIFIESKNSPGWKFGKTIRKERIMAELLIFAIGVFIGSLVTNIIYLLKMSRGVLRIDHSNPEKDVYRFEIDNLDNLAHKRCVAFKIDNHADLSQK